ncbi:Transcription initiation factor IIA subunit 1 [Trichoplax sp. H2]|nr:Transcription initiation factor IIA subunit 1 [Trichoplax sp. H2]|eukprot:RDD42627.1 Transcription initiation factor IIA subunit 1 [Trichoplax sp. H2]
MAGAGKESTPAGLYHYVINDVIRSIRQSFLNRGVDEQVLQELKSQWELKIVQSRSVKEFVAEDQRTASASNVMYPHGNRFPIDALSQVNNTRHSKDNASEFPSYSASTGAKSAKNTSRRVVNQNDGADDDDDDDDEDDDEEAVSSDESEAESGPASDKAAYADDGANKELEDDEPLNTDDDASDEDDIDSFECDNVIVCQYDKVTRARSKWKLHLKDGIMNIGGNDYVFNKASGDCDWA